MAPNSKSRNMERAVSRYSLLFTLPSLRKISAHLAVQCMIAGIATELPFSFSSYGLSVGLSLGVLLFLSTSLGNYLIARILLRKDLILDFRRCSFLSLVSNLFIVISAFAAALALASFSDMNLWFKIISLGLFASLVLRFLVFYATSFVNTWRIFSSVFLQPALFLSLLLIPSLSLAGIRSYVLLYFSLAVISAFLGVYFFIISVNAVGRRTLGIPSISMFKAFLANWIEDLEKPLEEVLEKLSEERGVKVSIIAFRARKKMKAAIVVPSIHPGPFKNIGSSGLPSLIQKALERKLGCIVSVPHGISGHELDLASQSQNDKVLNRILEASEFRGFRRYATPFISLRREIATVGCQIFAGCALLTLTLAPETMEDLPIELNNSVVKEAKKKGLACAVPVDAHNSLQGSFDPEKTLDPIRKAVASVLEKAARHEQSRFEVGAAMVTLTEFSIKDGIGPAGISVVITRVGDQKSAYVTIDGNNMVSGLREKILSSIQELDIDCGEILTTDTHMVNAVVMAERGYRPIGEAVDHARLIEYVKRAATEALENLEPAEAAWRQVEIQGVKVIGENQIGKLCSMIDEAARKAKKTSAFIFPAAGVLLTASIMLLP